MMTKPRKPECESQPMETQLSVMETETVRHAIQIKLKLEEYNFFRTDPVRIQRECRFCSEGDLKWNF